jgi:hypothetical protein
MGLKTRVGITRSNKNETAVDEEYTQEQANETSESRVRNE